MRTSGWGTLGKDQGIRKSTLKTWNSDLFCSSTMELNLVILKMAAGHLHERCTANCSRTMFTCWCGCPKVVAFYIWTVTAVIPPYTCMHFHFRVPIRIPVTLSEHCMSHSARFKNTMIELLETSKDPQISKGVDALKQLFVRKKDTVPRCFSRFRKCVLVKSPLMTRVGQASC